MVSHTVPPLSPIAYKKDDFLALTLNIPEDIHCADGPKIQGSRENCRTQQTDVLFANAAEFGNNNVVATDNDKLVARCHNGEWVVPSHECICAEEVARRERVIDRFTMDCHVMSKFADDHPSININGNGRNDDGEETNNENGNEDNETVTHDSEMTPNELKEHNEEIRESGGNRSNGFTNKVVMTTCGLLPAVFYNNW